MSVGDRPEAEIARLLVRAAVDFLGRGPERARVHITTEAVWVVLHETLTLAERTLVGHGRDDVVLQSRRALRSAMYPTLRDDIAKITGRNVVALLSDDHIDPTMSVAVFMLGADDDAPSD